MENESITKAPLQNMRDDYITKAPNMTIENMQKDSNIINEYIHPTQTRNYFSFDDDDDDYDRNRNNNYRPVGFLVLYLLICTSLLFHFFSLKVIYKLIYIAIIIITLDLIFFGINWQGVYNKLILS